MPRSIPTRNAILLATMLTCSTARAETQEAAVVRISWIVTRGRYDEAIAQVGAVIAKWPSPDPGLLYLRGFARFRLIRLGEAKADLGRIGVYRLPFSGTWPVASELAARIDRMQAAFPALGSEVRLGGQVAFRAYVDADDDWSRALLALLPEARQIGLALLGSERIEVPVFVFSSRERLEALLSPYGQHRRPDGWAWAWAPDGMLVFCRANARGDSPGADVRGPLFRSTVAHEYTHLLLRSAVGSLPLPTWLDEGIAMVAGGRASSGMVAFNDQVMGRLRASGAFLGLDELGDDRFYASYEATSSTPNSGPDAYQQSYSMVRYFIARVGAEGPRRLVAEYAQSGDLRTAFRKVYGADVPRFYDDWRRDASGPPAL